MNQLKLFLLALPCVCFVSGSAWSQISKPNIVLVFADDLGINDLSCYGRKDQTTPNLDSLAADGIRFTCAYTAQPICSPSRAALMTGRFPARLHLTNYLPGRPDAKSQKLLQPVIEGQLPLEEMTLAEWLKQAGYATGIFGKWHLGGAGFDPGKQGFDVVFTPTANSDSSDQEGGKSEFATTSAAIQFITANKDKPFFCYVPHNNPHIPLRAKQNLIDKHADAFHPTYAAMIETLDDAVGQLMHAVDQLDLAQRTVFIFTSDNGGLHVLESEGTPATHNTPYRAGKGYLYEGGLREPLIIRWPGHIRPASTSNEPVVSTDLVPTLLDAAGVDVAKTVGPLDGVSLFSHLQGQSLKPRSLFWHFPNYTNQGGRPAGALRSGKWKLIEQFEDGALELFDLDADPSEANNRAAEQSDIAKRLQQELAAWRIQVGAQMPVMNPEFDSELHSDLYIRHDSSKLVADTTAAATAVKWRNWRAAMNAATKGSHPKITPAIGDIRLHAKDARVHAQKMRYEPQSNKNVLGFWTSVSDWADWEFEVVNSGSYEVEVQQGAGKGSGGAEVQIEVAGQSLSFTVTDTGHFQNMIQKTIGQVQLPSGKHTLAVRPKTKPGVAVMDLRRVVLRPIAASN